MLGYEPPQPRYWKALLVVTPFVGVVAWSLPLIRIRLPAAVVVGVAIPVALVIAATVHYRMLYDWRSKWQMDVFTETRSTAVAPKTRIDRR